MTFWRDEVDPQGEAYKSLPKVMILRDQMVDEGRDGRIIKTKTYFPADTNLTNLPVIIWSHGLGGSTDGASFLSRYIASHGYVIVHIQHHGTDSSLWEGKPGHPWDIIRAMKIPRSATLNRFLDVPFVLNNLQEYLDSKPEIKGRYDFETIGMSGHSFGALTTQVAAGMVFPDEAGKLRAMGDARFKSGVLYSPGPIDHLGLDDPEDVYGSIKIPLFHMTGTDDSSPVEDWEYTKRLTVFENSPAHEDKHLLVIKDGDHMVFNGSRGKLGQNPNRELHEDIIKISALAYWDMTLKNDEAARTWLTGNGYRDWLGVNGEFK